MDRKEWSRIVEEAIDRYRLAVAGELPDEEGEKHPWPDDATAEDHVVEFASHLADVGREQLG